MIIYCYSKSETDMRKFNPFRSKSHHFTPATTVPKIRLRPSASTAVPTPLAQSITISAPITNKTSPIENKDRIDERLNVENQPILDSDNDEEQLPTTSETTTDDQPSIPLNRSTASSSPKSSSSESTNSTMVGPNNGSKEEILTSCKATAMIYNDAQKKWIHCAASGPAKIQLLLCSETQTYRIVGRQLQDHEVVLNHSISKGIKYNQATATFHQWRDQSCVYGLNFASKLDAQEFGATMSKILEFVNGTNPSQTIANGGATLPVAAMNNNNNNSSNSSNGTMYKRQSSQPPSSHPPPPSSSSSSTGTTVPISSSSSLDQQQQQQQHSSSHYGSHSRQNSNSLSSTPAANSTYYSHQHQAPEEDETNYALISDSYSYYGDSATTGKNSNIPQAPPLNLSMSSAGSAPPAAPPAPPPPPPPPPLPNGFGNGPPPAPALVLPTGNGAAGGAARKTSSAPPMDLMSEMAAKFAQRRKNVDENDKSDSASSTNKTGNSTSTKLAATLPPTAAPVPTSPRVGRKGSESHYPSADLDKLKAEILAEIRKDIEKAKQEILAAIQQQQHPPTKKSN